MFYAIVVVIALILDQMMKYWAVINIPENTGAEAITQPLIPGFIHLTNYHNHGAAFGFLQNVSWARWFFVVLCVLFVLAVIYVLARNLITSGGARWAAVIVLAGAIGNCVDRVITGYVVDMLEFEFKILGRNFPIFNVADIYITLGVIAFCIFTLLEKPRHEEAAPEHVSAPPPPPETARSHVTVPEKSNVIPFTEQATRTADSPQVSRFQEVKLPQEPAPQIAPAVPSTPQPVVKPASAPSGNGSRTIQGTLPNQQPAQGRDSHMPEVQKPAAAPAPRPAVQPAAPVPRQKKAEEPSYDLEDILAEFRDS